MTTKELVGPLPTVRFHDGTKVAYATPRDSMDPRYRECTDHRVACDCREAEFAEHLAEMRAVQQEIAEVVRDVLAGHPTWVYEDGPDGRQREVGCMCTGCQIVRRAYMLPHFEGDSFARDEIHGLDPDSIAAGIRWKVCTPQIRETHEGVCRWGHTRRSAGRPYHEHLIHASGTPVRDSRDEVPF